MNRLLIDEVGEGKGCLLAAAPWRAFGIGAGLGGFGSVYAFKADPLAVNIKGIAVND